jgi:multidrug efflux pump subunit AcrA (membrane-fusion protein)
MFRNDKTESSQESLHANDRASGSSGEYQPNLNAAGQPDISSPTGNQRMSPSPAGSTRSQSSSGGVVHILANVLGAILILSLGVFGLMFFGRRPEVATDTSKLTDSLAAPLVETADVRAWDQPFHLDIDGEAATYRVLTVGAEVTGRVLKKAESTRSGSFVNKGDVLFEIDPVNYQLDEQRLEARVNQAQAELRAIEVDLENAAALLKLAEEDNKLQKGHLERIKALYTRKAVSDTEMDNAALTELTSRNAVQMQQNQLNTLTQSKKTREAGLKLAQAELERTRIDLKRCTVVSPITGRVVDDMKEEGDYVKPGDELVHVSDSSRMEIKCSLKSQELAWIWQHGQHMNPPPIGTSETAAADAQAEIGKKSDPFKMPMVPCEIAFEFEGVETIWDGYLSRYEGTGMDRATRMFPCRVIVEEPEKTRVKSNENSTGVSPPTLLSGMYVTVRIPITSPVPLLQVPAESIRPGGQLWIVQDGKLRTASITVVREDDGWILIRSEDGWLKAGDRVVISPLASVFEGMPLSIQAPVEETEATDPAVQTTDGGEVKP